MKKQMILLLLFLLLSLTAFCAHAEIMDCFPEEKAANSAYHSQVFIPKVEAAMRLNPFSFDVLAHYDYTRCVYGIPAQSDLPEETALEIARGVLIDSFGRSDEWVQNAGTESYFDISDPNQPLWKFFFTHWDGVEQRQYVVRLQAETGEVIKAFEYTSDCESYERF